MTNSFYNPTGTPGTSAPGNSAPIRNEFAAISAAFDFFPAMAGNGGRALVVNGPGTALALTSGKLALAGDLTFLGTTPTTFSSVAGVTLTLPSANGTLMTFGGGTMTGILSLFTGSTVPTPAAGTNNTQIASTAFVTAAASSTSTGDRAYTDSAVAANSTSDRAYADTVGSAALTSAKAYTDTSVATNSTGDRAYTDTKSTGDRAYTDTKVATNSTGDRAYTDTKVATNSTSDRAYTDTAVATNSTDDRAYADGKFLPLTGGNVNGGIDATGTLEGSIVQAKGATGSGYVILQHSDTTHAGYVEFMKPNGSRAGYIGFGTPTRLNLVGNENSYTGWDMTGSLNVTGTIVTNGAVSATNTIFLTASGANDAFYYADGGSGHNRGYMMRTNGANRWLVAADTTAEGTASAGSNFGIYRYQDGAPNTPIGVLNINRATGNFIVSNGLIVDASQSGDNFQLWSTAVPPFARTISFTTTGWMLQFDGQVSDLNYWADPAIGVSSPQFTSQGTSGNFIVRGAVIGNNISAPSDERVKRDIEPYTRGLDDLIRLNPVIYSYNGLGGTIDDGTRRVGLGARASRDIVPECVFPTPRLSAPRWNRDGTMDEWVDPVLPDQLSLDDKPLIFALINAVKTLSERLHQLEQRKH